MPKEKFDWNQFPTEQGGDREAPPNQKFQWDQFPEEGTGGPEVPESIGIGEALLAVAKKIDSYTGAPVRKGISAFQDGKSFGDAISEGASQFGEDPDLAPTGKQIAQKAGVSDAPLKRRQPWEDQAYEDMALQDPMMAAQASGFSRTLNDVSRSGAAGLGVDVAADLTNIVPVAKLAKMGATGAAKGLSSAVQSSAKALDRAGDLAGRAGKRAVQGVFGIPEESVTNYIAKHPVLKDKVGAREMMEEIAGRLETGLKPASEKLAAAEAAVTSAKARRSEDLSELLVKRQEAKDALRLAQEQALGEAASRVSARVNQLDKGVSEGSSAAFKILDKEGVRVPTKKLLFDMDRGAKELAARAVTDEQTAVADLLGKYADRIRSAYPKDIPGGEAKRLLQSIDREMKHLAPGEIGRLAKDDQLLGTLRKRIDEPLKASSAYAEQMKGVAADTRLLMDTKDLASESSAARALQSASRPTGKDTADLIRALGGKYGDDFLSTVERSNLPEYAKLKGLISRYRTAKKGLGVKESEAALQAIKNELGDVAALSNQGVAGITDRLSSYVRAGQPKAVQTDVLRKAGDIAKVDLMDELKDVRTISSFEKGFNRGSANTNVWAAVAGGVAGSVFGPGGTLMGAAGGAAFGRAIIDNFGPAVGRKVLDMAPLLQKMEPAKWIQTLDVPNDVKAKLASDLAAYRSISRTTRGTAAASKTGRELQRVAEDKTARGEDRWAQKGIENLGITDSETASRIMQSKEGKRLLIEASDLPAGSKRLQLIIDKIQGMEKPNGIQPRAADSAKASGRERKPSSGR